MYERSAYLFYHHVKPYMVLRKEIKSLGFSSVVYMGFPDALFEELAKSCEQRRHTEGYVELLQLPPVEEQRFEAWKLSYPLAVPPEKRVSAAAASPPIAVNATAEAVLQKVLHFRLELASPMDCFSFVKELKDIVDEAQGS